MIQNSAEINFGGLKIVAVHSNDHPNYEITVTTTATIFKGAPAEFEAMCESHQLLKDAAEQFVNAWESEGWAEKQNAYYAAKEALRRAD